jgi:hypothetical protein
MAVNNEVCLSFIIVRRNTHSDGALSSFTNVLLRVPGLKLGNVAANRFQASADQCGAIDLTAYAATHTGQCTR